MCNRTQRVRINNCLSDTICINTGAPQGCCNSPLYFIAYTNDLRTVNGTSHIIKFADDTAIIGLCSSDHNTNINYNENISHVTNWCDQNYLLLNVDKTKEVIIDLRRNASPQVPISIKDKNVEIVDSYRYLGVTIDKK